MCAFEYMGMTSRGTCERGASFTGEESHSSCGCLLVLMLSGPIDMGAIGGDIKAIPGPVLQVSLIKSDLSSATRRWTLRPHLPGKPASHSGKQLHLTLSAWKGWDLSMLKSAVDVGLCSLQAPPSDPSILLLP